MQVKEVNENGKKEKSSSYTCGTTEDREPTHTGSFPDPSSSIWRPVFYSSGTIHPPESSMMGYPKYGMAKVRDLCCPILYSLWYRKV
jgi:hypothetical protein